MRGRSFRSGQTGDHARTEGLGHRRLRTVPGDQRLGTLEISEALRLLDLSLVGLKVLPLGLLEARRGGIHGFGNQADLAKAVEKALRARCSLPRTASEVCRVIWPTCS